jgi:hypothetical protein
MMFDIIKTKGEIDPRHYGYSKLYSADSANKKIKLCNNLAEAANYKSQKMLIMLKELDFDIGSLRVLGQQKKACLLFDLSKIIKSSGIRRSIELAKMRAALKFCNKYGTLYTFATFAEDEPSIRNSHELIAICMLLGINRGQAEFALKMLGHYL